MSTNLYHAGNRGGENRTYWNKAGKDVGSMVQGVSRQVIVVRSPDPRFFEQAIFIVKEDAFKKGVTADDVLQEAQRAASGYLRQNTRWNKLWRKIPGPVYAAAGAIAATLCWCAALAI